MIITGIVLLRIYIHDLWVQNYILLQLLQRNLCWTVTRPFPPRDGDVIHPVLWLVMGRGTARLILSMVLLLTSLEESKDMCHLWQTSLITWH